MIQFLKISVLLFSIISFAQNNPEKILNGKISADYGDINGIYVFNLKNEKVSITEKGGFFTLPASVGDTIMFSSINYKAMKIILKEDDLLKPIFFVRLQPIMNQLKEVMVFQYKHINAVAMGIIPKSQKTYTPAERKYNTASNPYMAFRSGLTFSADPLLNALSGRTAMLLKNIEVEKKEVAIAKTEDLFDNNYFTNKLKIPLEYVKGFQFFIVEDAGYAKALKDKNKTLAEFKISALAVTYLELISEKKF